MSKKITTVCDFCKAQWKDDKIDHLSIKQVRICIGGGFYEIIGNEYYDFCSIECLRRFIAIHCRKCGCRMKRVDDGRGSYERYQCQTAHCDGHVEFAALDNTGLQTGAPASANVEAGAGLHKERELNGQG